MVLTVLTQLSNLRESQLPQSVYWTWMYTCTVRSGHMLANEERESDPNHNRRWGPTVQCSNVLFRRSYMGAEVTGGVNRCLFKTTLTVPQQHHLQALLGKSSSRQTVNFPLWGRLGGLMHYRQIYRKGCDVCQSDATFTSWFMTSAFPLLAQAERKTSSVSFSTDTNASFCLGLSFSPSVAGIWLHRRETKEKKKRKRGGKSLSNLPFTVALICAFENNDEVMKSSQVCRVDLAPVLTMQ